jgi:hypothetical protein
MPDLPPELVDSQMAHVKSIVAPFKAEVDYANFVHERSSLSEFFDPHTYDRIKAVKQQYDPENVFQANFEID